MCRVLLIDNALVPWFILVPETDCAEIIDLGAASQAVLLQEINLVAGFVKRRFVPYKLNIAAIGNVVRQLHVHIVGRYQDDYAWPGVVWGRAERKAYTPSDVDALGQDLLYRFADVFEPCGAR